MLDTLPYADLLAIYNAIAEKPVTRFDTRGNGVRRTAALVEERGLTLAEAAQLANIVLPDVKSDRTTIEPVKTDELSDEVCAPHVVLELGETGDEPRSDTPDHGAAVSIEVDPNHAQLVLKFIAELIKPDRPPYVTTFLRRLNGGDAKRASVSSGTRERQMTPSQRTIIELCTRPDGATGKELAEGCGWPSIAARATCQKLADRFGYTLHERSRTKERGISFHMAPKQPVEA